MFNFLVSVFNNFTPVPMSVFSATRQLMDILQDNDHIIQDNVVNLTQLLGTYEKVKQYQREIPESNE